MAVGAVLQPTKDRFFLHLASMAEEFSTMKRSQRDGCILRLELQPQHSYIVEGGN
jgi:hypothetical protein